MLFRNHFLSERTQTALLVLYALRRNYLSMGDGMSKKDIAAFTGFPAIVVNNFLNHLHAMKLVDSRLRKFHLGAGLGSTSLYDLIEYIDGWVHLGNANLESITGNIPDRKHLAGREAWIRKEICDFLKSIRLLSLLPDEDEAVLVHSESVILPLPIPVRRPGRPKRGGIAPEIRTIKDDFR